MGEASHPGLPRRLFLQSSRRHRSRSRGDPTQIVSSDEEPLAPTARDSTVFTGSTVPASFHALLEVGVQEFLPSVPTIPASSRALEEAGVQVALTVADPSPVDSSMVVEQGGHHGHGRFPVMAMDADDSDVPEGSQHDSLMEALERDLEARTAVDSVESDTESVLSSEREGWSDHEEGTEVPATVEDREVHEEVHVNPACREAFVTLDTVDLCRMFRRRAHVMKTVPIFLKGAFTSALRMALSEVQAGIERDSEIRIVRGWKLFMALPRMLLHRPGRGGLISKNKLKERVAQFSRGDWLTLLRQSESTAEEASRAACPSEADTRGHSGEEGREGCHSSADGRDFFWTFGIGGSSIGSWKQGNQGSSV